MLNVFHPGTTSGKDYNQQIRETKSNFYTLRFKIWITQVNYRHTGNLSTNINSTVKLSTNIHAAGKLSTNIDSTGKLSTNIYSTGKLLAVILSLQRSNTVSD